MNGLDSLEYGELQLLAEVHRFTSKAVELAGGAIPPVGSAQWWDAEPMARLAGLLVLAEARLIDDLKDMAAVIRDGKDWRAFANLPSFGSHAEVVARRAVPVTPVRCGHSGCGEVLSVKHPLDLSTVRCKRHPLAGIEEVAA